jgi:hypothetical protein
LATPTSAPRERYYGHLERHVLTAGAVATEEAVAQGSHDLV